MIDRKTLTEVGRNYGYEIPDPGQDGIRLEVAKSRIELSVDSGNVSGWTRVSQRKSIFVIPLPMKIFNPAKNIRKMYQPDGVDFVYLLKLNSNYFHQVSKAEVASYLRGYGFKATDFILNELKTYRLVNKPFQGLNPTPDEWNLSRTQLAIEPAKESGPYPTWQSILDHCGEGFNEAVADDLWCRNHGLSSGADYLKMWAARMMQYPEHRLPGIGLFSEPQDCGKSAFGFSHSLLFTHHGYCSDPRALTETHNGQLAGVVLWDFDDVDFSGNASRAYGRLLSLMTKPTFGLRAMQKDEVQVANNLHFIHTANEPDKFALQDGDTRWCIAEVQPLEEIIPQQVLTQQLLREAPYYLRDLLRMQFPEPASRLYLPILDTPVKNRLMASRAKPLTQGESKLLVKLIDAAKKNKLNDFKSCKELSDILSADINPWRFAHQWRRFAPHFDQHELTYEHRKNLNGNIPSAFLLRRCK